MQYALTFPVPNDRAREVIDVIARKGPSATSPRRVFIVRHAEKQLDTNDNDPPLSNAGNARAQNLARWLAAVPLRAILVSDTIRSRSTAAPIAAALGREVTVVDPQDAASLANRIAQETDWTDVLVVGHSNTIPPLVRALGIETEIAIADDAYDRLFVVRIAPRTAPELIELRY